jgi:hypothetical protein
MTQMSDRFGCPNNPHWLFVGTVDGGFSAFDATIVMVNGKRWFAFSQIQAFGQSSIDVINGAVEQSNPRL